MAIVEDEVRNDSEEENEIEVVVEEDDGDQDFDDSDDDDEDEALENKVEELERRISEDPYNYDDHINLIQALWSLSELERWRSAFDRLQQMTVLRSEHWLLRLQTELTLAHSEQSRDYMAKLFQQAALDCYSIPILSEWCTWALGGAASGADGGAVYAREQVGDVLSLAGADPVSGMMFWDAKLELEKAHLESMTESDPEYGKQRERVLFCLEEAVSRPLLRAADSWPPFREFAQDDQYVTKVEKQHEAAKDYLEKIAPFEDKLLIVENLEEKVSLYQEYIDKVKELARDDKYADCDSNGILKVLYDRATTECLASPAVHSLLLSYAQHTEKNSSTATYNRVLDQCVRRCPRRATFWALVMQQAEEEGKEASEVKSIFERALAKGMETYKEAEALWLSYLEYSVRRTFNDNSDIDVLRRTFRLAWDSLGEAWGAEADDCEVPLYWARLEYRRLGDHKQGKEIFEEIFKYGENKTMSKYWEALISLESNRTPPPSENKLRDLYRRALKFVTDYPPAIARLWTDYERDWGRLETVRECTRACEEKIKEWRESYQAMKDKMTGKQKGKQPMNKKAKFDKKKQKDEHDKNKSKEDLRPKNKGKRKSDESHEESEVKRKRDEDMEVEGRERGGASSGTKRSHKDDGESGPSSTKRTRTDSASSGGGGGGGGRLAGREACTLFVSNLEFKVDEQKLRDELSKYGDIVSLRVKAGVKAFGGSICYCQYKTAESVEEAIKHDRTPLAGRPMFFSRYSASKSKHFQYATTAETNKVFVRNLPYETCTKEELAKIFDKYGEVKDIRVVTFKDGKPKGLAYVEYADDKAAALAVAKADGLLVGERNIEVAISAPPPRKDGAPAPLALGQPKRESKGGMRRTQLSSFIPSVLQKASTSQASVSASASANGGSSNGEKRSLSNTDFRNLLLKK